MRALDLIRTVWIAFPAAPETRRLRWLRMQFLTMTGLLLGVLLLPNAVWHACPALILLVAPFGMGAVLTGTRYFVTKSAQDDRYQRDRIAARAFTHESPADLDRGDAL